MIDREGAEVHRIQVKLPNGVRLEARTRGSCDFDRARRIARRLRKALRAPRWADLPAGYRGFVEDVRRWHDGVDDAVVMVVKSGDGLHAENGDEPVLILPVSMPAAAIEAADWFLVDLWDRR